MNANKLTRFSLALITGCAIIAALVGFKTMPPFVVESLIDDPLLPDSVESLRHYLTNNAEDIDARQKFALLLYRGGHHSEAIQEMHQASKLISARADLVWADLGQSASWQTESAPMR